MGRKVEEDENLVCSFCGKTRDQVRKLIAGPGVYICDDCVQVCDDILKDIEDEEGDFDTNLKLPKPKEIKAFLDEYVIGQ